MKNIVLRITIVALIAPMMHGGVVAGNAIPSRTDGCFSIVVGKNASADGWVIMAHNEDDYIPQIVNHHKVPRTKHDHGETVQLINGGSLEQIPETWSYTWSEIPGLLFSDSYLNEWGICVCSDACPSREDNPDLTDGGITYMLRRIVAERARTAREGVRIAGSLIERFGYASSGRTYIICDPSEGWLLAAVNGKHWVAQRVPDDRVAVIANTYTIHTIDLTDTMNYLACADVIDYAVERGWYDPQMDGEFDFAAAYADPGTAADENNIGRQWDGIRLLAAEPQVYGDPLPFAVTPAGKVDVGMVMSVLRSHYEGTELYEADSLGCPHGNEIVPICRHETQTSFIAQLRGDVPNEIGLIYWLCLSSPCISSYIPFYFGIDAFPLSFTGESVQPAGDEYSRRVGRPFDVDTSSIFWTFTHLRHTVENNYPELAGRVRTAFDLVEKDALGRQALVERDAAAMFADDPSGARSMLNEFTHSVIDGILDTLKNIRVEN